MIELDEVVVKDPEAVLPFWFYLGEWLAEEGDTVTSEPGNPVFTVDPAGELTVDSVPGPTFVSIEVNGVTPVAPNAAKCWLSGGTASTTYRLTCQWTTTGGRTDQRSARVAVRER